jgi:putative transcriptional regulator
MAKKVKVKIFEDVRQALAEAVAWERGEKVDLRISRVPSAPKPLKPDEIRRIRIRLHASQAVFARFLCVSPKAVQSWEQGLRRPQSSALRLLEIAKRNPRILLRG